jgi:hypothetical protein
MWPADILMAAALLSLAFAPRAEPSAKAQEKAAKVDWRRHDEGPLTKEDFEAQPPNPLPSGNGITLLATTQAEVRHTYRYRFTMQGETTTVVLQQIEFFAVLRKDLSWNSKPDDAELLDHEQGHFDLAAIIALKCQRHFDRLIARNPFRGQGKSEAEARDKMVERIDQEIDKWSAELISAHQEYDRVTKHGTDKKAQAEQRKKQKEELGLLRRAVRKKS